MLRNAAVSRKWLFNHEMPPFQVYNFFLGVYTFIIQNHNVYNPTMSSRLPLQSRAVRPKFQNKRAIFGDDEDEEAKINDERILGIEDNKVRE